VLETLDRAYAIIYRSKLNVSQALARIREDAALMSVPEVRIVVEFIANSKRGILRGPQLKSEP
jgi:acyl-[acyl carrier protein]--UDP-N-acetylglucosamine O-acyltransferase